MSKHTPGPWKVHRHAHIRGELWLSVLHGAWDVTHNKDAGEITNCKYSAMSNEENLANAHLIAAAPDLLAACEAALHDQGMFYLSASAKNKLQDAITKAKGLAEEAQANGN